jgi:hypothetical protein
MQESVLVFPSKEVSASHLLGHSASGNLGEWICAYVTVGESSNIVVWK